MKSSEQQKKLSDAQEHSLWTFILIHGMLKWGVSVAVLASTLHLMKAALVVNLGYNSTISVTYIAKAFLLYPVLGMAWGLIMWVT